MNQSFDPETSPKKPYFDERVNVLQQADLPREMQEEAFANIVKEYGSRLIGLSSAIVGSHHIGEEAVQEVLLRTWNARERLDPTQRIRSYLYKAVVNQCQNIIRERGRQPQLMNPDYFFTPESLRHDPEHPALQNIPAKEGDPLQYFWCNEILASISRLKGPYARVLQADMAGLNANEIAEMLHITPLNAKVRAHRARRAAKEHLAEDLELTDLYENVEN